MRILNVVEMVVTVPATHNYELVSNYNVEAIGDGKWSIEAWTKSGDIIKVWVGSNGTLSPADDLWSQVEEWGDMIAEPAHKAKVVVTPDGYRGSYKDLRREIFKGNLHGCVIAF